MGYNTRRKSLSLPSLGIQLPTGSRAAPAAAAAASHRSPPAPSSTDASNSHSEALPPAKKLKRSHTSSSASPSPTSPSRASATSRNADGRPSSRSAAQNNTPPPSPGAYGSSKIDTQGIDDDIVVAVIEQLEKTGNKPHLLKELAAVLCTQLAIVQGSANQSAIISSRLTSYLRRPWSALSPCPVGKELIGTHPKRIYFFLTTCEHQPFPAPEEVNAANAQARAAARIVSPSLSSAGGTSAAGSTHGGDDDSASAQHHQDRRRARQQLSPSPELDLTMTEAGVMAGAAAEAAVGSDDTDPPFDLDMDMDLDPDVPGLSRSFSLPRHHSHHSAGSSLSSQPTDTRRAVSPPLEGDEREFTRTASELQALAQLKRAEEERAEQARRASRELSHASGSASSSSAASSAGAPATPGHHSGAEDEGSDAKMTGPPGGDDDVHILVDAEDESEETCALRNSECAAALFGAAVAPLHPAAAVAGTPVTTAPSSAAPPHARGSNMPGASSPRPGSSPSVRPGTSGSSASAAAATANAGKSVHFAFSSPVARPSPVLAAASGTADSKSPAAAAWAADLLEPESPENVDLAELDQMFDCY